MIQLRPYQTEAIERIRQTSRFSRAILVVSPTGSGKTTIASEVARLTVARGRRVLWLAHRAELVDQAFDRLREFGLIVGTVAAKTTRPPNPYAPVQVASIQTLLARDLRPEADTIIWDEAHHAPSDLWSGLAQHYASSLLLGFTATPERSDGRGLGAVYTRIVTAATVRQLVELGSLVPCDIRAPNDRLRPGSIAQRPIDAWQQQAKGRRTIVFSPSIIAAEQHAQEFNDAGVPARVVTGSTPAGERSKILSDYRAGRLPIIVNVYVLTEGFDAPETSCVILARGCGTAGTFLQMVGRGLRPASGKADCLLLDLHGVTHGHGRPDDDRIYSLDGRGISSGSEDAVPGSSCRVCGAPIEPGEACSECGTEPKLLKPPNVTGDPLVKYAAKRSEDPDKRAKTLARWIETQRASGYKPGWPLAKFKAVYGAWPDADVKAAAIALVGEKERAA